MHLYDSKNDPENVCTEKWCMCFDFEDATPINPVKTPYRANMESIQDIQDKVEYILATFPEHRDSKGDDLITKFREMFGKKGASETITRTRRKLAEKYPDTYGPTKLNEQKIRQFDAFREYAISN